VLLKVFLVLKSGARYTSVNFVDGTFRAANFLGRGRGAPRSPLSMNSTDTSVACGVSQLRWSLHGCLAARDVLLLVHGPRGRPADWDPLLPALCEGGAWRCLCLDSTAQEAESIDAATVLALLDTLGAGTRAIVSATSGSALAVRLGETAPGFATTCFVQDGDSAAETSPTDRNRVLVCSESYVERHRLGKVVLHKVPGAENVSSLLTLEATAGTIRSALASVLP